MRAYVLDKDFAFQASALPTEEIRRSITESTMILQVVIGRNLPADLQSILVTIPEVFMWVGHEALLYEFVASHMDEYCKRVNTHGSPEQKLMSEYQRFAKIADGLSAILFSGGESNNYRVTSAADIPDEVIESHRAAFVAEMPFQRMRLFPRIHDLSIPYLPLVHHHTD